MDKKQFLRYELTENGDEVTISLFSGLRFVKSVNFVVKPFIRKDVVKNMKLFGVQLSKELKNATK